MFVLLKETINVRYFTFPHTQACVLALLKETINVHYLTFPKTDVVKKKKSNLRFCFVNHMLF